MSAARKTIEVQDKRMMRTSSARKSRSNKIYTAKGPRDRRIRLSADIAIQFYDVQDRLGYQRATEAFDWLLNKAKGSIDKLFDSSFQQQNEHLTHLLAQNSVLQGDYLTESISNRENFDVQGVFLPECKSSREDYGVSNSHNSNNNISVYNCTMDSSMFLPRIQMESSSEDQCFAQSAFSNLLGLEHSSMPSFPQVEEKGQNPRLIMFNSKLNSKNGEHPFISNSVPLFLQPPNNDSSSFHTPRSEPELNLCLPGNCASTYYDSDRWTIF